MDYVTSVAAVIMMYKPEQKSANLKSQALLNSDGIQSSDVVIGQMWPSCKKPRQGKEGENK